MTAWLAIERENEKLRGVLYRDFARLPLEDGVLGDLMGIVAKMKFDPTQDTSRDVFGEVYEYFLGNFAPVGRSARRAVLARHVRCGVRTGGNPRAVCRAHLRPGLRLRWNVRLFRAIHQSSRRQEGQAAIYGQELSATTRKLACMNLPFAASTTTWGSPMAIPSTTTSTRTWRRLCAGQSAFQHQRGWGADKLPKDPRWKYGVPPDGNANYAWLQHAGPLVGGGRAGIVLANGSMTTQYRRRGRYPHRHGQGRRSGMHGCPAGQLFANTQIPACLWFFPQQGAGKNGKQDRRKRVLFIDARKPPADPRITQAEEFSEAEIRQIAQTTIPQLARHPVGRRQLRRRTGFCKSATLAEIEQHGYALTPGRYVGATDVEDDDEAFEEQMAN